MQKTMKAEVFGRKRFVGIVDGKSYDMTKIFIKTHLDQLKGTAVGYATQELEAGKSSVYDNYCNIPLPAEFEINMQLVSTGKIMKQIIVDMCPATSCDVVKAV